MRTRCILAVSLCLVLPTSALADFSYTETTKVTGGSLVSLANFASKFSKGSKPITDPTTSSVYVQGNRMAKVETDFSEIIDLDAETVTRIDPAKKEYSVTTFQEMKQAMEAAMAKAKQQQAQMPQQQTPNGPPPDVKFKVSVTNTGASKQVVGLSAAETILKMTATDQQTQKSGTFGITNDMWMVPEIPGYEQVRDFNRRFAEKMGSMFSGSVPPSMMAMNPGRGTSMKDMADEMSKIKGVPVSQIMRMGSTVDGTPVPAASEMALPQSNTPSMGSAASQAAGQATTNAANSAANTATSNAENAAGSHMGSFSSVASSLGGFGFHKKKPDQQQQPQAQPTAQQQNVAVLMETSIETTNLSSGPVDPSKFAVPAGYAKVLSDAQKELQKKN